MADDAEILKEKKRKKGLRRMGKIVGRCWNLPNAEAFHSASGKGLVCLASLGQKVDEAGYRGGRHGWEDFARDIGGVYNRHISRKTKHSKLAKAHVEQVCGMLAEKDPSLAKVAKEYVPPPSGDKKRKASDMGSPEAKKRTKSSSEITISQREEQAMQALQNFIQEKGGTVSQVESFTCRVQKQAGGRYDTNYYNAANKRFRSMVEVARSLGLIKAAPRNFRGLKKKKTSTKEIEAEKKKLRKELEKLRKQHTRATKALDDFTSVQAEGRYPMEDTLLQEEVSSENAVKPTNCAAARVPDIQSVEGFPSHVIPEVLVAWDFLTTFTRALSLHPISLDHFVACLNYKPPKNLSDSDALKSPPIYLGEAHLGLLNLLLSDKRSDDWWWSILETPITENAVADLLKDESEDTSLPLIKVDFSSLLREKEDPLITTSWLQALKPIFNCPNTKQDIRQHIQTAMGIVGNKFVLAYLRKALKLGKTSGVVFMKRAVLWLVAKVREARPDLSSKNIAQDKLFQQRAKVVEEVSQQMDKLSSASLSVQDEDLLSDVEDSDDESDEDDDEDDQPEKQEATPPKEDNDDRPASYIPNKPPPTLIDLLLPPGKPIPPSELLNPSSWPHMAGTAACRVLHRYKRLRNEVDDSLRLGKELPQLTVKQRREREAIATSRVFSEFVYFDAENDEVDPCQHAVEHLCSGGNYLDLTPLERLCILRILMEAAYDTARVYEIVDTNYKQRVSAVKALDLEQRRAKKQAKEKNAANELMAREDLVLEAKRLFLEEKRDEIRQANQANHELTDEEINDLTEEDIIEFDDDIKADFEALPAPESFKKAEVVARVAKILEAAAFETDSLTVLKMEEILERESSYAAQVKENLAALGGEDALLDPELDRDTARGIDKLRKELIKIQQQGETLPAQREAAIEALKEAIGDGTMKSLRTAIRVAKTSKLFGKDDETNGIWALDVVRDAHMELETAKQLKRVADAQKELISKRNKCFIRTEPLGTDRFRNRVWRFETSEQVHVWTEVDYVISQSLQNESGCLELVSSADKVAIGNADIEQDFFPSSGQDDDKFRLFSRREYHQSGACPSLTKRIWGCQVNESSVRALTKGLDSRGIREGNLKKKLKEALEEKTITDHPAEKRETPEEEAQTTTATEEEEDAVAETSAQFSASGDESYFAQVKQSLQDRMDSSDILDVQLIEPLTSGMNQDVRVRIVVEMAKTTEVARYEVGKIAGWKIRKDEMTVEPEGDVTEFEPYTKVVDTPVWRVWTEKGAELWLTGVEMLESISRHSRWKRKEDYFEPDAAFLSYRNALGRYFGRAADAPHAMTPIRFTQYMVKREAEIYQKLKHHIFDNSWGGKNASRNVWITSMRDYAFDFETAREGLLTLENALFELTGGFPDNGTAAEPPRTGQELLDDPVTREDIELESLEKGIQGLWNSRESRAVFLEIVKSSKTVGFLGLALELVCRNTHVYMDANKMIKSTSATKQDFGTGSRASRRTNAWQQQDDFNFYGEPTTRRSRRGQVDYSAFFD